MEKVVSQGTNRSDIRRRRRRIYRFEEESAETSSGAPAGKGGESTEGGTTNIEISNKRNDKSGISLAASFPAYVDFEHPYRQLLMAIKTKPFLLMTGMCGSGKSRFARALAYQTCPKHLLWNK